MTPRSWLFVPGDKPALMTKALASGADALILDLEDSVAPANKALARDAVAAFLRAPRSPAGPRLWVRINDLASGLAVADVSTVMPARPAGIVLPKPDSGRDVLAIDDLLTAAEQLDGLPEGGVEILPIATETPLSIFNLHSYVGVTPRLAGLTWGAEDLSAAIGAATARDEAGRFTPLYDLARSLCLAGAAAAGAAAIETVYPDFRDLEGLAAYLARARRDGFVGMMAIHPTQVAPINAAFAPTPAEIEDAGKIVALFAAQPEAGALALDGRMVDRPHLCQAQAILARQTARAAS